MANMRITMENFQFITIKIIKIRCKMNKNIIFDCTLKKKDKRKKNENDVLKCAKYLVRKKKKFGDWGFMMVSGKIV
jgi:hypothetical protein